MSPSWQYFLGLLILCVAIQAFYSMLEMACVSFNRVRLQWYVAQGKKRAKWLNYLLNHPTRFFGTTLIGVNTALQFGSESSRQLYAALGLSPDWAPLTQVFIVLIFAELAPMFAARKYAEHVTMLGIPIIYFSSWIIRPILWILNVICRFFNWIFRVSSRHGLYLTREELQKAMESREEAPRGEIETISQNIFSLKSKTAKSAMIPLDSVKALSATLNVGEMRKELHANPLPFIPLYQGEKKHIVAIAYLRDYVGQEDHVQVQIRARPPWFITEKTPLLQILKDFRNNHQSLAIVLGEVGSVTGIITLDAIIDEIFGERDDWISFGEYLPEKQHIIVDRTYDGDISIQEINLELKTHLPLSDGDTLEDLMIHHLGRHPEVGDRVKCEGYELTVEDVIALEGLRIHIHTL